MNSVTVVWTDDTFTYSDDNVDTILTMRQLALERCVQMFILPSDVLEVRTVTNGESGSCTKTFRTLLREMYRVKFYKDR